MRVLVIEDDIDISEMICSQLKSLGHKCAAAFSVQEGIEKLNETIDAITLDLKLPNGLGTDILRRISRTRRDLPVIVISAYPLEDQILKNFPFYSSLPKPYSQEDFDQAIEKAHGQVERIREIRSMKDRLRVLMERLETQGMMYQSISPLCL